MKTIHFAIADGEMLFDKKDIAGVLGLKGVHEGKVTKAEMGKMFAKSDLKDGDSLTVKFKRRQGTA